MIRAIFSKYVTVYNVITLVTLIILLLLLRFGVRSMEMQQQEINRNFVDSIKDSYKCPETAKYFAKWQSTYNTWAFGLIGGVSIGLSVFAFLLILNWCCVKGNPSSIPLITAFSTLVGTMVVYKLMNCFIGRVCGQDFCGKTIGQSGS